ncbi:MAG: hydroxyisourate hydrolase [Acidimicrobiia bacterium]
MISTHVLDTSKGKPAVGVPVSLSRFEDERWTELHAASTADDGRIADMMGGAPRRSGVYRLVFNTASYGNPLFPEVAVMFRVVAADQHHHIPLLVSDYGYTVYRGS